MLKHPQQTLQRIQQFTRQRGILSKLYPQKAPVGLSVYHAPDRIPYAQAIQAEYQPAAVGDRFRPFWSTHWFRVVIEIPKAWAGQEVHLLWDSGSEAEIYENGHPIQGLAGSGGGSPAGPVRSQYVLTRNAKGGETRELYVEMAVNHFFGLGYSPDTAPAPTGTLIQAEIAVFDREAWDLLWDMKVIAGMAAELPGNSPRGAQALFAGNAMVNAADLNDRSTWADARKIAAEFFAANNGDGQFNLSAIGHAHIDTAWLWPLAETRRKCTRTFSTAILYMDEYPAYKFACSQAQQLEWVKEMHPDLYARIKEKVKAGQFVPVGGSWVEPDCNLPSGEALVRQFLYGQRFFEREFGRKCDEFWEPDVFGYTAALPQILKLAGIKYFLTIKLSWNQYNKLHSHTFWWEGLDGSRVLTHFPPADNYNAMADVKDVLFSMTNYKDLDRSKEAYMLFGFGDGGGGPTLEMLEQVQRMKDVDGLPKVEMRSANDFFTRLEKDGKDFTTWVGELYFELHRGTYTTQADNKKFNRQSEIMLHDVELLSALAHASKGYAYPHKELDRLWKKLLTNQFHDIIPGSSINLVYQDSDVDYQDILGSGAGLRNQAAVALFGKPADEPERVCAVNMTSVDRKEVIELPDGSACLQVGAGGKPLGIVSTPSYGYTVFKPGPTEGRKVSVMEQDGQIILENDTVRATLRSDGSLASLYNKRIQREALETGKTGNRFILFDDQPNFWDAWDVDIFHLEKQAPVSGAKSFRFIEEGPLRAGVTFEYEISPNSTLTQTVYLTAISTRLDFQTEVEWHEKHKFLKVEFPLQVRSMQATYEIQFGHLQRPTHFNTSWDFARFEVPAHHWADLSEGDFGVALVNDSKYGYSTHDNVMRLSLLRAPTSPDPEADQGHHSFRYALLPHMSGPQAGGVIEEGYRFNQPMLVFPTDAEIGHKSFFQLNSPAMILDTVKKAEDSNDLIVRMYESRGTRGKTQFHTSLPIKNVKRVNLLEEEISEPGDLIKEGGVEFNFHPFEIISFKLSL